MVDGSLANAGYAPTTTVLEMYRPQAQWLDLPSTPTIEDDYNPTIGGGVINGRIHICNEINCRMFDPVASEWVLMAEMVYDTIYTGQRLSLWKSKISHDKKMCNHCVF